MWLNHTTVSSCSSSVARYAVSTILTTFCAIHASYALAARNDEGLIALGNPLPEVTWSTTPRPVDPVTGPPFIDAEAAVDPPQAIPAPRREQPRHNVTREWMLLFLYRFPMRRVGVLLLPLHGEIHGPFVGKHIHRMTLTQSRIDQAESRGRIGGLKRWIHQ